jgi:HK97 family phage portal protein
MDIFKRLMTRISSGLGGFFGVTPEFNQSRIPARKAIEYAPVWYAVNKIAGHFSQLPVNCHRRLERGSEIDRTHPGHSLVHQRPNYYQTAPEFKMLGAVSLLLWGNWRCAVIRDGSRPIAMFPLLPDRTSSVWFEGVRYHGTTLCEHDPLAVRLGLTETSQSVWFKDEDVFFVHGLSLDGLAGINPVDVMGGSIDAGMSAESQVRNLAKKGFSGSLVLEAPAGMFRNEEESRQFLKMFRDHHDGDQNAGKTAMLREGIKANMITMSGRDSQWIEQRLFQRQEAAMWFCLEEILGDDSSVSYNSLAEKHLAYLTNCLNRWLVHIEAALGRSLLTERQIDEESHYFRFNTAALMRMDPLKQAEYFSKLIGSLVMNPNEAREKLDMNPYDGGDAFVNPSTTSTDGSESAVDDDNDDTTGNETPGVARAAAVSRIRHLIAVEQDRVVRASKTKNVVAAIEKFYSKWQESLGVVCEELGGDASLAAAHCERSQTELLELLSTTAKEALPDAVGELTASWGDRAESLADQILEQQR